MDDLSAEAKHALIEAAGFRELGMAEDSAAALSRVPAGESGHPAVLLAWCETEAARENWTAARDRALSLTSAAPSLAAGWFWLGFALRRAESPAAAWRALRPVVGGFSEEPVVDYNFACYACLDGQLDQAKASLDRLFATDPKWRECALRDEDLLAIRDWLLSK